MRILSVDEVTITTGLSRSTLLRLEGAGKFPKRLQISPSRVGWRSDEIDAWLQALPRVSVEKEPDLTNHANE